MIGTVVLILSDNAVMKFQQKMAACLWKSITINQMVIIKLFFRYIPAAFQNGLWV